MSDTELHIYDGATNGETIHARHFDEETGWTVEVCGNQPKLTRQLLATGATRRPGYASLVVDATTEQLIQFLAAAAGYRCKLQRKVKRQYSPETLAAMRERASAMRKTHDKNAVLSGVPAQD